MKAVATKRTFCRLASSYLVAYHENATAMAAVILVPALLELDEEIIKAMISFFFWCNDKILCSQRSSFTYYSDTYHACFIDLFSVARF